MESFMNFKFHSALLIALAAFHSVAQAQTQIQNPLSPIALFNRCYSQITQTRPAYRGVLATQVSNNQIDPITACLQVLDKAKFNSNGTLAQADSVSKSVLKTFHNLHATWFRVKDFPKVDSDIRWLATVDIFDNSTPALYFTKALFENGARFDSAIKGNINIEPMRTNNSPTVGAYSKSPKTDYITAPNTPFASIGELLGYRMTGLKTTAWNYLSTSGTWDFGRAYGAGLIGTPSYLLLNVQESRDFKSDGAIRMPRRWAKSVYSDILCRELPLVRDADALPFVANSSSIAFRRSQSCVGCHASIDRMSSTIRGFNYHIVGGEGGNGDTGIEFLKFTSVNKPSETSWPVVSDSDYSNRPTNGALFFRDYKGNLVDVQTQNLEDMGQKISNLDDYYICAARRYYAYFTGIDVNTGDIEDPTRKVALNSSALFHRNTVIDLGLRFKAHQSSRQLIEDILKLPHYRMSNYGL